MGDDDTDLEFTDEQEPPIEQDKVIDFTAAVLHASDWTVETILSQLRRRNIEMNPRFQRRDAWNTGRKSKFIESVILGLPIPQIVLAEKREQRGRYIVLDGKQRLLSLLQFTSHSTEGPNCGFALSGLEAREDLKRVRYLTLDSQPTYQNDLNAFLNHTIRTVVIRNWPSAEFLHLVFLRLNTGSVKLSPQELRQALFPGSFSDYVDDASANSQQLHVLLSRKNQDPRMRDVELLVRYLGFKNYLNEYAGRMSAFIDFTCERMNKNWSNVSARVESQVEEFNAGTQCLIDLFGSDKIARKVDSRSFNRAIFDALSFYAGDCRIRIHMKENSVAVVNAYHDVLQNDAFRGAVESDTAGVPNTHARLWIWGDALRDALHADFRVPEINGKRLSFKGLWR